MDTQLNETDDSTADPPPDLAEFVANHGGAHCTIPPDAWAEWDYVMSRWQARRRLAYGPPVVRRRP
jgi:hypothetical protein